MVATCQTETSSEGFDVIHLYNATISLMIMPQLGGKIYQLTDLRSGRNWLWNNPHIDLRHPSAGLDYEQELDTGGWDEILFSVKPCTLKLPGTPPLTIGDHGVLVERAWHERETGTNTEDAAICDLFAEGQSPDFRFQRRIVLHASQPRFDINYTLSNIGSNAWPWLWCAHPLFAIEEGMNIELPTGRKIYPVHKDADPIKEDVWPNILMPNGNYTKLASIFEKFSDSGVVCQKLFVNSAKTIGLRTANNAECLSMSYNPEDLPWLGLWINKNAWSGCGSIPYLNLGIEPATTPYDSLLDAVESLGGDFLQPGESRKWQLTVSLQRDTKTND